MNRLESKLPSSPTFSLLNDRALSTCLTANCSRKLSLTAERYRKVRYRDKFHVCVFGSTVSKRLLNQTSCHLALSPSPTPNVRIMLQRNQVRHSRIFAYDVAFGRALSQSLHLAWPIYECSSWGKETNHSQLLRQGERWALKDFLETYARALSLSWSSVKC